MKRRIIMALALPLASLPAVSFGQQGPTLTVNASSNQHPISAGVYGVNALDGMNADDGLAAELHLPVRRWGGNSTSRYNWQHNMHTAVDWYFENIPDGADAADGSLSDQFVEQNRTAGTQSLITIPMIGWTAKSGSPRSHPYACSFKISKYGAQTGFDADWDPDCGNGKTASGNITGNDPADTSTAVDPTFVTSWINHLTAKYGTAANGGVAYYNLDNEPGLWNETHRDVYQGAQHDADFVALTSQYAAAVKTADPSAKNLGPAEDGWCRYFYSAADNAQSLPYHCGPGSDHTAHGDYVPWYLQQMQAYEQANGVRILDYLDLHYYPQANGVALAPAGDSATQALRLRSTRALWDASYVDESWIGTEVKLIPRMKAWVAANYPGTKTAISEYNWGGLESINGALAQADVLGIFGREGVDMATLWAPPSSTDPGSFAFRLYLSYDGAMHGFGDISTQAASSDQEKLSIYAARRSADQALTIMVINKTGTALTSAVSLAGFTPGATASVHRYSAAQLSSIEHAGDQAVSAGGFTATFPGNSITLFVILPDSSPVPPTTLFPALPAILLLLK